MPVAMVVNRGFEYSYRLAERHPIGHTRSMLSIFAHIDFCFSPQIFIKEAAIQTRIMLNGRPEPVQSIDQPADATESETGSDMPVFSRGAFFQFLDSFNPNGERRRRRRDKGKQPAEGATLPPNPKGFFANERTFLSWMQCA